MKRPSDPPSRGYARDFVARMFDPALPQPVRFEPTQKKAGEFVLGLHELVPAIRERPEA